MLVHAPRPPRTNEMRAKMVYFPINIHPSHRPSSAHNKGGRRRRRRRSRLGRRREEGGKRKRRNKREEKEVEGGTSPAPGRYPSQQETRVGKVIGGPRAPTPIDSPPSLPSCPSYPPMLCIPGQAFNCRTPTPIIGRLTLIQKFNPAMSPIVCPTVLHTLPYTPMLCIPDPCILLINCSPGKSIPLPQID